MESFYKKNRLKPFKKVFKFLYICIENDNEYFSLIINEDGVFMLIFSAEIWEFFEMRISFENGSKDLVEMLTSPKE